MKTPLEFAENVMKDLPKDCSFEKVLYEMYFSRSLYRGLKDVEEGRTRSWEEVKKDLEDEFGLTASLDRDYKRILTREMKNSITKELYFLIEDLKKEDKITKQEFISKLFDVDSNI